VRQLGANFLLDFHDSYRELLLALPAALGLAIVYTRGRLCVVRRTRWSRRGGNRAAEEIARGYDRLGDVRVIRTYGQSRRRARRRSPSYRKALSISGKNNGPRRRSPAEQRCFGHIEIAQYFCTVAGETLTRRSAFLKRCRLAAAGPRRGPIPLRFAIQARHLTPTTILSRSL